MYHLPEEKQSLQQGQRSTIQRKAWRSYLLIALVCCFASISMSQSGMITVMGSVKYDPSAPVIKLEEMQGKPLLLAEDTIDSSGKFSLSVLIHEPGIFRLSKSDKDFVMMVLHPGDSIQVTSTEVSLNAGLNLNGNLETQLLHYTGYHVSRFEKVLDSLQKVFQQFDASTSESEKRLVQDEFMLQRGNMYQHIQEGIRAYPNSLVWLFFIEKMEMEEQFPWYVRVADSLRKKYPDNPYVKSLFEKVDNELKLAIGSPAPDITGPDPDGNILSLSQFRGKVVLIDFWAGWCGPCRRENPNLVRLYEKYHKKGFEIFAVSLDRTRESWLNAIAADGLTWPQVSDLKYWQSELSKEYKVSSIPHTVLVDRGGNIIAKKLRGEALEKKLEELLGGSN